MIKSLTGQAHDRVQTETEPRIATVDSCLYKQFQFGLYHVVAPLSFLRSISLASFCYSDRKQFQYLQIVFKKQN